MGDRTYTSIRFSGIISAQVAEGLIKELEEQHCKPDKGGDIDFDVLNDSFYDEECNYATMEGVEAYCQEHHISYHKSWSAGGDYGPGMEIYNAIVDQSWQCPDLDGEPVLELKALMKAHGEGKIEDMIGYLKGFQDFEKNYPPLEIQGQVTEGERQ